MINDLLFIVLLLLLSLGIHYGYNQPSFNGTLDIITK